ncbi:MAG TPA: hypothetical protein V6C65_41965 [Allocoleopsis sp.]
MMKRIIIATLSISALSTVISSPVLALSDRFEEERQEIINKLTDRFEEKRQQTLNK